MATEVKLPNLGEGIAGADVSTLLVAVGDTIDADQPVVELETDKAAMEIPAGVAGVVKEFRVKVGDTANVGEVFVVVEAGESAAPAPAAEPAAPAKEPVAADPPPPEAIPAPVTDPVPPSIEQEPATAPPPPRRPAAQDSRPTGPQQAVASAGAEVPAAPSTRRFAREIGIDIRNVPGSGPGGRISKEDVKTFAKELNTGRAAGAPIAGGAARALPDFSQWGPIDPQPMSKIRAATAQNLSMAWQAIPHVTQNDKADITEVEANRQRYKKMAEAAGGKLTITAILMKIVAEALKRYPQFNSSVDMGTNTVVYKDYIHIGIAVDTERGLLVPVVRNVDQKSVIELAAELGGIAERARNKKLGLDEMQGGTFTISNLGGIGGTSFTPIVNWPEVAILGVSRGSMEPVWKDGEFVPRLMMPMSLSYDHRVIDGANGARFLRWIVEALENPLLLVM
jgi:pyruvate dehydrogenase E2 component (dihydrolipoamide acetyltransferase)